MRLRRLEIDIPLFEFYTEATIRRTVQAVDDTVGRQYRRNEPNLDYFVAQFCDYIISAQRNNK